MHTVPTHVGSPAMDVIAAIPLGNGHEFICTVIQPTGPERFATVHAYLQAESGQSEKWSASAGHYDFGSVKLALRDMLVRAEMNIE